MLVIDVQGARQVRPLASGAVSVFVLPPSFADARAAAAGPQPGPERGHRAAPCRRRATEVSAVDEYDYVVINDDLERCVKEMAAIVTAERARRARRRTAIEPILQTFRDGGSEPGTTARTRS